MTGLSFGKDEVRKHLLSLGYSNVSEDQLADFCKDLKRLIRYEEKQNRIQAQLQLRQRHKERQKQRPRSADSTYSSGTDGQNSPRFQSVQHERSEIRFDRKSGNLTKESLITTATVSYEDADDADPSSCASTSNASVVQERRKVTYRVPQAKPQHQEVVKVRLNLDQDGGDEGGASSRSKQSLSKYQKEERPDFDGGCFELLNRPTGSTMTRQILPPRPQIPTKPTTSCIKPTYEAPTSKPTNRDPVALYADYKKHWDKLRLPGDGSDKQLRWAVREWMMSDPPK